MTARKGDDDEKLDALYEAVCGPNNQQSLSREIMRISARQDAFEAQFRVLIRVGAFLGTLLGGISGIWHFVKGDQ